MIWLLGVHRCRLALVFLVAFGFAKVDFLQMITSFAVLFEALTSSCPRPL